MSQQILEMVEKPALKSEVPTFAIGDTVDVHTKILEGDKERIQIFTGVVIARSGVGQPRDVHGAADRGERRRRAEVPAALAEDREDRGRPQRRSSSGEAVLPARSRWQGRAAQGTSSRQRGIIEQEGTERTEAIANWILQIENRHLYHYTLVGFLIVLFSPFPPLTPVQMSWPSRFVNSSSGDFARSRWVIGAKTRPRNF